MIFAPVNPKSARQYFKRRVLQSYIVLGSIFLLLSIIFSWVASLVFENFIPLLLGNASAGLVAYYCYVIWNKQPMRMRCPECRGIVLCETPWICGECRHENLDVRKTTLLDRCAGCDVSPKAYVCHHCNQLIFLSEDRDGTNPALRANAQGHEPRRRAEAQRRSEESFEEKKRSIEQAKLDLTEEQIKAQIEVVKKGVVLTEAQVKTALDLEWESLTKFMDANTALDEAVRRMKARNAEQYPNNPTARRKLDMSVDKWAKLRLEKLT